MIRTQISFDADLYASARKLARREGISLAELCRRALRLVLASSPPAKAPGLRYGGVLGAGDALASAKVDEVVYGRQVP